jgi:hypothetical protein
MPRQATMLESAKSRKAEIMEINFKNASTLELSRTLTEDLPMSQVAEEPS